MQAGGVIRARSRHGSGKGCQQCGTAFNHFGSGVIIVNNKKRDTEIKTTTKRKVEELLLKLSEIKYKQMSNNFFYCFEYYLVMICLPLINLSMLRALVRNVHCVFIWDYLINLQKKTKNNIKRKILNKKI